MQKSKLDTTITVVLVVCAVVTTGLVVRREFFPSPAQAMQQPAEEKPVMVANWREHLSQGKRMGPAEAPVQLIEFADFECPFCATFHKDLKALRERYPTQVALTYVHFPLDNHRFAVPAARAAECADAQGRFEAMYDQIYTQQKELGLKPWSEMATAAGVTDLAAFDACIQSKEPLPQVEQGMALGKKIEVRGTPTLLVNGWKLGHPPSSKELDEMVKAVLAGKSPVDTGKKAKTTA